MSLDFVLPDLGEGVENSDILVVSVLVGEGQRIEPDQPVVELETDKAVIEVPCPHAGVVTKLHVGKGDSLEIGQLLLTLETEKATTGGNNNPTGIVSKETTPSEAAEKAPETVEDGTQHDAWGPIRREPLSQIRQTIARQMSRSASTIPHVTNFDDADVTELEGLRKNGDGRFGGSCEKLTLTPFIIKAVATALVRHPVLNSQLDEENNQVIYKQYVNVGVAVDTPRGLVVPVLRDTDKLSVAKIADSMSALAQRARDAQFEIEELRGGSFTLSNLGAVGGSYSTPIINYPEAAILLLGRARWMPVVHGGKIESRLMLPLSLSYDHRLIDGATAARFLNDIVEQLQSLAGFTG